MYISYEYCISEKVLFILMLLGKHENTSFSFAYSVCIF